MKRKLMTSLLIVFSMLSIHSVFAAGDLSLNPEFLLNKVKETPPDGMIFEYTACTPPWQPAQFQQNNMSVIAKLYLSGVVSTNAGDAVGAFVGTECRGIGHPDPSLGGMIFLTITSNAQSGETVTFKSWNSSTCQECTLTETMAFVAQSEAGTMANPFLFHCECAPALSVSPASRNVSNTAGTTTFAIANTGCGTMAWTATSNQTWCTLSPASGTGNTTLTATCTANTTCASRTATITITATGATGSPATVTVVQAANTTPILSVTPANQNVTSTAGTTTFAISNTGCGTQSWTATSNQTWCTLSPASGTGNANLTATYSANSTGGSRTVSITIAATGATGSPKVVTVLQQGSCTAQLTIGTASGIAGNSVCVPVTASGFSDVVGFQFTIEYDNTKLAFINCVNWGGGTNTSTTALVLTPRTDGKVTFVYNADPVNFVSGKFFDICFTILPGVLPGLKPVSWSDIPTAREISNSVPEAISTCYTNGSVNVITGYTLAGDLAYKKSGGNVPLVSVPVELSDAGNASKGTVLTDVAGRYSFEAVQNGAYSLKPDPSVKYKWGGATSMDLTSCKKHIGTAITLEPLNAKACDVNGSGSPTSMDITLIQKRIGTSISSFSVGDWAFDTTSVVINGANRERDILALCYGDVNGSYDPALNLKMASNIVAEDSKSVAILFHSEIIVPFTLSKPVKQLSSVTLELNYPEEFFDVKGIEMVAHNEDLYYTVKDGVIRVVFSVLDHLTLNEGDQLLTIRLGLKENLSRELPSSEELRFTGAGEFGDYDDRVLEGVILHYPRLDNTLIADYLSNMGILIYPNPARDKLTIRNAEGSELTIIDNTGRKLLEIQSISDPAVIELITMVTGTYVVRIYKDNGIVFRKITVSK